MGEKVVRLLRKGRLIKCPIWDSNSDKGCSTKVRNIQPNTLAKIEKKTCSSNKTGIKNKCNTNSLYKHMQPPRISWDVSDLP